MTEPLAEKTVDGDYTILRIHNSVFNDIVYAASMGGHWCRAGFKNEEEKNRFNEVMDVIRDDEEKEADENRKYLYIYDDTGNHENVKVSRILFQRGQV